MTVEVTDCLAPPLGCSFARAYYHQIHDDVNRDQDEGTNWNLMSGLKGRGRGGERRRVSSGPVGRPLAPSVSPGMHGDLSAVSRAPDSVVRHQLDPRGPAATRERRAEPAGCSPSIHP
jgi:hypothetical protein